MSRIPRTKQPPKEPRRKNDPQEFAKGKKGIVVCPKCSAVYYKKAWHHDFGSLDSYDKSHPLTFKLCPADEMIRYGQHEGRITFFHIPVGQKERLEELIRGFTRRAEERDPLDRLIEIKKSGSTWRATFTNNQTTHKLAKKIKQVFSSAKKTTRFVGEPSDVVEITIEF